MEAAQYRRVDVLDYLLTDTRDQVLNGLESIDWQGESNHSYKPGRILNNNYKNFNVNNDIDNDSNRKTKPRLDLTNEFDGFTALMEAVYGGSEASKSRNQVATFYISHAYDYLIIFPKHIIIITRYIRLNTLYFPSTVNCLPLPLPLPLPAIYIGGCITFTSSWRRKFVCQVVHL